MARVYVFHAAVLCEECGESVARVTPRPTYARPWDSDDYPSGPHDADADPSDSPQSCDACGAFIPGALTREGCDYIGERFREYVREGFGAGLILREWAEEWADALEGMARVYAGATLRLTESPLRPSSEWVALPWDTHEKLLERVEESRRAVKRANAWRRAHWRRMR